MRDRTRFEQELIDLDVAGPSPAGRVMGEAGGPEIRLTHFHVRKAIAAGTGTLAPDPAPGVMTPARMQPGYVLPSHASRRSLQGALDAMLRASYAAVTAPPVHLRVGLVDLTGARHHAPVFAGHWAWGPNAAMEGGSLTKILALYALYQLRFDLDTVAARAGITKASALLSNVQATWKGEGMRSAPDVRALFRLVERPGHPVVARLHRTHDVHHNSVARNLIVNLGFEYIGSVALQSALFDPAHGGLWLNAAYNTPAITWTTSPFPKVERHNATALATATYFTLLGQGRLVNEATSREIGDVLARRVVGGTVVTRVCMGSGILQGIQSLGGVVAPSPNKCGILPPFYHEGVHVVRHTSAGKRLEYAVAVLSKEPPELDFTVLGRRLDALIVAANP